MIWNWSVVVGGGGSIVAPIVAIVVAVVTVWPSGGEGVDAGPPRGGGGQGGSGASDLHYAVREEIDVGSPIADIVTDAGLHHFGVDVLRTLRFKFLQQPPGGVLAIDDRTGVIRTAGRLDRDRMCRGDDASTCQVRLDVVVQPMAYFRIVKVAIDVVDVNDNVPRFEPAFRSHELSEASPIGVAVILPAAIDEDSAMYAVKRYQLIQQPLPPTPPPTSTTSKSKMPTSSSSSSLSSSTAADSNRAPSQLFELKVYRKMDGSSDLKLVLVQPLDRELADVHRLRVVAYDGGDPPRIGSMDVEIRVLDANDNAPVFERPTYDATVLENSPLSTTVARVKAVDRDLGVNGEVTYYLSAATVANYGRTFAVDNVTGDVVVTGTVDYETTPVYQLMVSARDRGGVGEPSTGSADAMVIVRVADANDNAPVIAVNTLLASNTDRAAVPEDAGVGTFVAHVVVRDPDSGINGRYNCTLVQTDPVPAEHGANSGDTVASTGGAAGGGYFRLRSTHGPEFQVETARQPLDREVVSR